MAGILTKAVPPALAVALLLFLARPVSAECRLCGCMSWFHPPQPSLPVASSSFGYNKTVWQTWPEACSAAQPAILAHPVAVDAFTTDATSHPDEWAHTNPNASGRLLQLTPAETKLTPSQSTDVGDSPYHPVRTTITPAR